MPSSTQAISTQPIDLEKIGGAIFAYRCPRETHRSQLARGDRVDRDVVFSPDGRTLATGSDDRTVRLWDLTPLIALRADPGRVACSLSRTGLTRDAWERYVPDSPYHDICINK